VYIGAARAKRSSSMNEHVRAEARTWAFWIFNFGAHCGMHTLFQRSRVKFLSFRGVHYGVRSIYHGYISRKRFYGFGRGTIVLALANEYLMNAF